MSKERYSWHKIALSVSEIDFESNRLTTIEVAGKKICLSMYNDTAHACAHKCPHAGGILADGYIDALGNIVCPVHRYKFNIQNGCNTSGEGYYLKTFPIEIRSDGVFVGIADNNFFGLLK